MQLPCLEMILMTILNRFCEFHSYKLKYLLLILKQHSRFHLYLKQPPSSIDLGIIMLTDSQLDLDLEDRPLIIVNQFKNPMGEVFLPYLCNMSESIIVHSNYLMYKSYFFISWLKRFTQKLNTGQRNHFDAVYHWKKYLHSCCQ